MKVAFGTLRGYPFFHEDLHGIGLGGLDTLLDWRVAELHSLFWIGKDTLGCLAFELTLIVLLSELVSRMPVAM